MADERTVPSHESLEVEFKSDRSRCKDATILEAAVSLANTEGGVLYLGVEDDGAVTGLHAEHKDFLPLSAFIANNTMPPLGVRIQASEQDGNAFLRIEVPKSRSVLYATSSGRVLYRRLKADGTPESIPMFPQEMLSRMTAMQTADYSATVLEDGTWDDFDETEMARIKKLIRKYSGEETLLQLPSEDLVTALGLAERRNGHLHPTIAGILLIGREESLQRFVPTAKSVFQCLSSTLVEVNDDFFLPILAAIERMLSFIEPRVSETELELERSLFRRAVPNYNMHAVREAVVNAYSHRDYTRLGRVRVMMDDREMIVSSPGGFVDGIQVDNLLRADPHGRNPRVADALKRIGLAERTGRGLDRIFDGTIRTCGVLPKFSDSTSSVVSVRIPKSCPDAASFAAIDGIEEYLGHELSVQSLMLVQVLMCELQSYLACLQVRQLMYCMGWCSRD